MITILHTYYPPEESLKSLNLKNTYWTHSGYWDPKWEKEFECDHRYIISNRGKDIGGKLFAFQALLEKSVHEKYVLFLHDKKSPQVIDGTQWKNNLWSINNKIDKAIEILEQDATIGIIANKSSIIDPKKSGENYAYAKNRELLFSEATQYEIMVKNKSFVAGVTFIARLQPYLEFFKAHSPLLIRAKLEEGNVLDIEKGTYTHSWERLLSWILTSKGYGIASV